MENEITMTGKTATIITPGFAATKTTSRAIIFTICFISTIFSGVVTMLMSAYLPVTVKDLLGNVSDEKMNEVSAYINSLFIFGWMFGGFLWGFICDKIGRSRSAILSTACYGLFTLITAASSTWMLASASRFFSGFGIGGVLVTTTILISEMWPEKKRAIALGIVSIGIPVGFFAAGAINNLVASWRQAFMVGIVPVLLSIIAIFILPESIKWKEDKQSNKTKENFNKQLFDAPNKKNLLSGSIIFGAMLIGLWAIFSWAPTWAQNISSLEDAQKMRGLTIMIMASGGLAGSFSSGWIANAIGLRKTMMMCFAACFLFTFLLFKLNTSFSTVTYAEMILLAFFFGISQGALAVYIPQIFPTAIRASATGFCFNIGRLFTGVVVFFIGALVTMLGGYGNAIFIFSFVFVIGFVTTFISKEKLKTKN
ncbi:MAG TPA: MFS transporter [Puia sp.]|jgi:MFS family permease|nr:MFS transporter [Puia sp.]